MSRRAFWIAAFLLSVLLVAAIWCVDYIPTNDGPQHVFIAWAGQHLDDPAFGYGRWLERGSALTSRGFEALYGGCLWLLPSWRSALSLALSLMALSWAWAFAALARSLRAAPGVALLGFAATLQWSLYMGLFSFHIATGVGLWALAWAFRRERWSVIDRVGIAGLLAIVAVSHVFAALLFSGTVGLAALLNARGARGRLIELARLAVMTAPVALIALATAGGHATPIASTVWSFGQRASLVGRAFVSGPAWRCWPFVGFALAGAVSAVRTRAWRSDPRRATLLLVGATALVVAVAAPVHLPTWQYFSPRFLPLALPFLALLLSGDRMRPALPLIAGAYAVIAIGWSAWYHRDLRARSADALAGLDVPLRRTGVRLDLVVGLGPVAWGFLDRAVPFATPLQNLGPLYAAAHGGVTPWLFAGDRTVHHLVFRRDPDGPVPDFPPTGFSRWLESPTARADRGLRQRAILDLLSYGPGFEDVIFYGDPDDVPLLRARGYQIDLQRGGLAVARFVGCPVDLELEDGEGNRAPVSVEVRWIPPGHPVLSTYLPPRDAPGGPHTVRLAQSPCGELWLRAYFDRDRNQKPSPGDRICAGAGADGFLRVGVAGPNTRFRCAAGPEAR